MYETIHRYSFFPTFFQKGADNDQRRAIQTEKNHGFITNSEGGLLRKVFINYRNVDTALSDEQRDHGVTINSFGIN